MSQARVKTVTRAQKDQGECEKCSTPLPQGSSYRWFKVGFRTRFKHKRCMKPECFPRPSELESSKLSEVYAFQEDAESDIDSAGSIEDIKSVMADLETNVQGTAEEYREAAVNQNTGVTFNVEAEERGDALDDYASEVGSWEPDGEPDLPHQHSEVDEYERPDCTDCGTAWDDWFSEQQAAAKEAVGALEM